jgi:hypothetical protein
MPSNEKGSLFNSKMVDFALVLRPEQDTPLSQRIISFINPLLDSTGLGINQTLYSPLQNSPIAIAVETKTDRASAAAASIQLATWTAAWHERMKTLGVKNVIELPLLQAIGADWKLWIAFDEGDHIVSHSSSSLSVIGRTNTPTLFTESCRSLVSRQHHLSCRDLSLISLFKNPGRLDRRRISVVV